MTHAETAQIIAKLHTSHEHLLALIAEVAPDALITGSEGVWGPREILAHLANAEADHRRVAQTLLAGQAATVEGFDLQRWNEARVASREGQSVTEILADFEAERAQTLRFIEGLEPADLAREGLHPALGQVTIGKLLRVIAIHEQMHQRELAAALGR